MLNKAPKPSRILITGATGNVGSATLAGLDSSRLDLVAGVSAESCRPAAASGIHARLCDYRDADGVAKALEGVDAALLLVPFHEEMVTWGTRFARAASGAGVRFILRVSGLAASIDSPSKMGQLHGQIDAAVKSSGIAYCILRCNAFMQNFSGLYGYMIRKKGMLLLPEGAARLAFVDTRDIGELAAGILARPGPHCGKTYDLGGPEALSNAEATAIIASVTGRPVEYRAISREEARERYRKLGVSTWKIDVLDSLAGFIRDGHAARRSTDLERLLRRAPGTFEQFARDYRKCWVGE